MPSYVLTSKGMMDRATGEIRPFVNRVYDDENPFPLPRVNTTDDQEPLVSMADGKTYTSKAKMRESYKASNNPQGVNYIEVGHETRTASPAKRKPDRAGIKDAVERAAAEMRTRGELP